MRWRPVAAAAAGVVAVVGLGSHRAAADTGDEGADASTPTTTTPPMAAVNDRSERLAQAAALSEIANALPQPSPSAKKKPAPATAVPMLGSVLPAPSVSLGDDTTALPPGLLRTVRHIDEQSAASRVGRTGAVAQARAAMAAQDAAAAGSGTPSAASVSETPSAAPVDDTSSPAKTNTPASATYATTTGAATNSSTGALPPTVGAGTTGDQWWPAWAEDIADQRLATAWRSNPVRGPPPGVASALGNDGRTTIYQVSVVDGRDGFEVGIATQDAGVNNVGIGEADALSSGSATATGDQARTSIYQTTVVVQRGTGTANVEQATHVDNLGSAVAASAGSGDASAVGNASSTTVNQTAVVLLLGSGDARVSQTADVANAGGAISVATDQRSSAVGSTATTDVSQIAVLVVHDDDVTVSQTSSTTNVGGSIATGGTANGNNSTNRVSQVSVTH